MTAVVSLRPDQPAPTIEELRAHCVPYLADYKMPKARRRGPGDRAQPERQARLRVGEATRRGDARLYDSLTFCSRRRSRAEMRLTFADGGAVGISRVPD